MFRIPFSLLKSDDDADCVNILFTMYTPSYAALNNLRSQGFLLLLTNLAFALLQRLHVRREQ